MKAKDFESEVKVNADGIPQACLDFALDYFRDLHRTDYLDVSHCIQLARRLQHSGLGTPTPTRTATQVTVGSLLESDRLAEAVRPWIDAIRSDLFGGPEAPFENSSDAFAWLKKTAQAFPEPVVADTIGANAWRALVKAMDRYEEVTGREVQVSLPSRWISFTAEVGASLGVGSFPAPVPSPLYRLAVQAEEIAEGTGFHVRAVIAYVLLGVRPVLAQSRRTVGLKRLPPGYRIIEPGRSARHSVLREMAMESRGGTRWARIDLFSKDLSFEDLRALYREVRSGLGSTGSRALKDRHRRLLDIIERLGGAPPLEGAGRQAWWESVMKEWNRKAPKARRYTNWRGPKAVYQRIQKKLGRGR